MSFGCCPRRRQRLIERPFLVRQRMMHQTSARKHLSKPKVDDVWLALCNSTDDISRMSRLSLLSTERKTRRPMFLHTCALSPARGGPSSRDIWTNWVSGWPEFGMEHRAKQTPSLHGLYEAQGSDERRLQRHAHPIGQEQWNAVRCEQGSQCSS